MEDTKIVQDLGLWDQTDVTSIPMYDLNQVPPKSLRALVTSS